MKGEPEQTDTHTQKKRKIITFTVVMEFAIRLLDGVHGVVDEAVCPSGARGTNRADW